MKVILKSDVSKLGKAGSLLDEWKAQQARMKTKDEKNRQEALELQKKLQGKSVTVEGKAGENGKLFGSVTASQVAEALASQHGLKDFDKRDIKLDETIKQPGNFPVSLKLYPGIQAEMTLTVKVS